MTKVLVQALSMAAPPVDQTLATIVSLESQVNMMRNIADPAKLELFVEKVIVLGNSYLQMIEEYRYNTANYDAPFDKAQKMYKNLQGFERGLTKLNRKYRFTNPDTERRIQNLLKRIPMVPDSLHYIKAKVDKLPMRGSAANPILIGSPAQSPGEKERDPSTEAQDERRYDMQRGLMEPSPSTPPASAPASRTNRPSPRSLQLGELLMHFSGNPVVRPSKLDFGGAPAGFGVAFEDMC